MTNLEAMRQRRKEEAERSNLFDAWFANFAADVDPTVHRELARRIFMDAYELGCSDAYRSIMTEVLDQLGKPGKGKTP